MEYKKFDDTYIVRLNRGEEIINKITQLCELENIKLGNISGIGSGDNITVGLYNVQEKKYYKNSYTGAFEITSLAGNISTMNDKPYLHIHINFSNNSNQTFGGHLNECYVLATCEICITKINGQVYRYYDDSIGLNLYDL